MSIEEKIPRIHVAVNEDMSNEEYIRWNIQGATRGLAQTPDEATITLMVYDIHKNILRKRGVKESDFVEGDRIIEEIKKKYHIN